MTPRAYICAAGLALAAWLAACQGPAATLPPTAPQPALSQPAAPASPSGSAMPGAAQPTASAPPATPAPSAATPAPAQPTASRPAPATPSAAPIIHLLFTGDINPGRCPAQISLLHNDFTRPYRFVGDALRAADIAIGSLDGALSDLSPPSPCPKTMNLIGPTRTAEGFVYAGFDVITVATNHAKDCGLQGWQCQNRSFHDTLATLKAAGILAAGGGENLAEALRPVIVERHGVRFAFIGVTEVGDNTWAAAQTPGTAPLSDQSLPLILAAIAAARPTADVVIVLPQWGVEYAPMPSANQMRWGKQMIDAGATLVIGNQAHVVQPVELFGAQGGGRSRGVVAYALGNFVFDQGPWIDRQGVLFEATFEGAQLAGWRLRPIHIYSLHQPQWAGEAESGAILARVAAASAALPPR